MPFMIIIILASSRINLNEIRGKKEIYNNFDKNITYYDWILQLYT